MICQSAGRQRPPPYYVSISVHNAILGRPRLAHRHQNRYSRGARGFFLVGIKKVEFSIKSKNFLTFDKSTHTKPKNFWFPQIKKFQNQFCVFGVSFFASDCWPVSTIV